MSDISRFISSQSFLCCALREMISFAYLHSERISEFFGCFYAASESFVLLPVRVSYSVLFSAPFHLRLFTALPLPDVAISHWLRWLFHAARIDFFPFLRGISIFSCSTESDLLVNSRLAFALHPVAARIPDVLPSFFPYATGFYLAVNKLILLSAFSPKNKFV